MLLGLCNEEVYSDHLHHHNRNHMRNYLQNVHVRTCYNSCMFHFCNKHLDSDNLQDLLQHLC